MSIHIPVLLKETIEGLALKPGQTVVDATLGGGGHAREILKKIGPEGKLIALDVDENAIEYFRRSIANLEIKDNVWLVNDNFNNLDRIFEKIGVKQVDAILADLGYSSDQLEDPGCGLSFLRAHILDMRLDKNQSVSAHDVVNQYDKNELTRVFREYGEERFASRIAERIIIARQSKPIKTTQELVEIIKESIPRRFWPRKIHPATKVFQAIRIEVNQELVNLKKFIQAAMASLQPGGRLAVISFHSLEDRLVKNLFKMNARGCVCPKEFPQCRCEPNPLVRIITRKPITVSQEELDTNPRSRSAKLRIAEKI